MATQKVLRKMAWEIETVPGTYQEANIQVPWTSMKLGRAYDLIEDESITGVSFADLPLQGVRKQDFSIAGQLDVATIAPMLEAAFGSVAAGVYSCPATKNEKSLSVVALDSVKTNKYGGCFVKNFKIATAAEGALGFTSELVGYAVEVRDGTAFPTLTTTPGTRLQHRHAGGTGYIRIGDQANILASGDNIGIESFEVGVEWNFDNQFDNTSQGTLLPLSGAGGRPTATFTFKISRHDADTFTAFKDNHTALQAAIYIYSSATASLLIEIPNFVIPETEITDDDIPGINITAVVARNGLGTSYSNSNMSFVTPIRISLVNS